MQGGRGNGGGGRSRGGGGSSAVEEGRGGEAGRGGEDGRGPGGGGGRGGSGRGGSGGTAGGEVDERRSSQVVGVSWDSSKSKWRAQVTVDGKQVSLGYHATEEAAAQAIDNYVKDGVAPVKRRDRTSQFKGVSREQSSGKWLAKCKDTWLGYHATEEAAALAYTNYVEDGVDPVKHPGVRTSQHKGVGRDKSSGKWRAEYKGKYLGLHATEEAAALAYNKYVKNGVAPVKHQSVRTYQCKGVSWHKGTGKWRADCKGTWLGLHATEEAAALAYNIEAERLGLPLNNIPPTGSADDSNNTAVPVALALLSPAAPARGHAGAGSKRTAPSATAPQRAKKTQLDTSAGAAAGAAGAAAGAAGAAAAGAAAAGAAAGAAGAGAAVAKAPPAKRPNSGNGRGQTHNSCHVIHPLQTIVSRIQRHTMTRSPMIHLAHHVIGSTSCASVV